VLGSSGQHGINEWNPFDVQTSHPDTLGVQTFGAKGFHLMANTNSNRLGNNGGRAFSFLNRPVTIDCNFVVDSTNGNGLGIRNLKGSGVQNVYMYTSATPATGNPMGQAASEGYVLVQLENNYNRYAGGFSGAISPTTGSAINIDATDAALTVGTPYVITSVGHAAEGQASIVAVADSSGSLASKYLLVFDAYGNTFVVWFYVTGVGGSAPIGVAGQLVQVTIAENAANTAVAAAITSVMGLIVGNYSPANQVSFTASTSGHTSLLTNTSANPYNLPGAPQDGVGSFATGFTLSLSVNDFNNADWAAVGLPTGVTPNIGASFIATSTGAGASTGQVHAAGVSNIIAFEVVGDPSQTLSPIPVGGSPNVGGWIIVKLLGLPSSGQIPSPVKPNDNSVIGLTFNVEAGSITIAGE
jgi:hypothetical protein